MKILFINAFHYKKGGSEAVYFNTAKLMEQQGHEVIFFSLQWKQNIPCKQEMFFAQSKETNQGWWNKINNITNYFYHTQAKKKLQQLIRQEKPDIAHVHLFWGQISPSIFSVLEQHNIPLVHTAHDYRMVCPAYTFRNGKGEICEKCKHNQYYHCLLNKCSKGNLIESFLMTAEMYVRNIFFNPLKHLSGIIFVSNFAAQKHIQHKRGFQAVPSIVLHNFCHIQPTQTPPQKENYFLYLGRLSSEKGINTLLEVAKNNPTVQFKIVGTGPLESSLKEEYSTYQNIQFTGHQTGEALTQLIAQAYFVVVPSEWYENNPMSIIESYSLGTPVIGSNMGGIPEIIKHNETGFIIEQGNKQALSETINKAKALKTEEYQQLTRAALKFANEQFNEEKHYRQLRAFYEIIITQKK